MWSTDDLPTREWKKLQRFFDFISKHTPRNEIPLSDDEFAKLIELTVSCCPRKGVYFKVYKKLDRHVISPITDYLSPEEIVSYLFDLVELHKWQVVNLEYNKCRLVHYDTKYDLVHIFVAER